MSSGNTVQVRTATSRCAAGHTGCAASGGGAAHPGLQRPWLGVDTGFRPGTPRLAGADICNCATLLRLRAKLLHPQIMICARNANL